MNSERLVEASFTPEEVMALDGILRTVGLRPALQQEGIELLRTDAGRAICRKTLELRAAIKKQSQPAAASGPGATPRVALVPSAAPARAAAPTRATPGADADVSRDWPTGEWTEEIGRRAVLAMEQSGLSETAFCRASGISRGRIRGWKRKLGG